VEYRVLGRTDITVSAISFGAWAIGGTWGKVDDEESMRALHTSIDSGVNFVDTADVYGDGRSEQIVGSFAKDKPQLTFATKMGRRMAQEVGNYNLDNFRAWNDRSRANLGVDTLDLVQLHCPPTPVFSSDAVYDALDTMVGEKRIKAYGVSVEKVDEALAAIARPGLASVQIILNAFRLKPLERVLPAAAEAGVGIIARVPLASGLLSGKYDESTTFSADDQRNFNRHGEAFDVGETFSGVDFATGLEAVRRLRPLVPAGATMAQFALRWIVDQPGVTVVIPGARNPSQAQGNAAAADLAPLSPETLTAVSDVYDELIRPQVDDKW
jgi:aryl-alcohol dehydrogenase-like predicted oxidoreductase